jgi:hypothetical protein
MDLEVVYLPATSLVPYKNNTKDHPDWQIDQIAQSIRDFGFVDPIGIASDTMEILEGHGRIMAVLNHEDLREKYSLVPTIDLKDIPKNKRQAYRIVHNKTTMNSGFIRAVEIEEVVNIMDQNVLDLTKLGYSSEELMKIGVLSPKFDPVDAIPSRLDKKKTVTCPECGAEFEP